MNVSLDDGCFTHTDISNHKHLVEKLAMLLNVTGVLLKLEKYRIPPSSVNAKLSEMILETEV